MAGTGIAKIFKRGHGQAVHLPRAFRPPGDRVRVRRVENGILLQPMVTDLDAWFADLDRFAEVPFMEEGGRQPPMREPNRRCSLSGEEQTQRGCVAAAGFDPSPTSYAKG